MQSSGIPVKFAVPFGNSAVAPNIRPIPQASQIGVQNGAASLETGFPPNCFVPISAGGSWPFGQDFNGLLKQVTQWDQWQQAGGPVVYDAAFATAIGGYPAGATLYAAAGGFSWISKVDNNTANPDTTGSAAWLKDGPYVSQGGGNLQGLNVIHMGWDGTNGLVRVQVDATDMGGIAFQSWVSAHFLALTGGTVTGALVVNGQFVGHSTGSIDGNFIVGGSVSSTGNIVTSGQLSSQLGLNTSGGITCGVTVNPDPVGSGLPGIVITPQGFIDSFSANGCAWGAGNGNLHSFFSSTSVFVGSITNNGSSTGFNTTSDYRLKVNIIYLVGALDRISSVPVHRFAWVDQAIDDPNQQFTLVDGWLAHELAVAVPEAVTGTKDAVQTYTNAVLSAGGMVIKDGVSEADWEAGKLAVPTIDYVPAVKATETTPAIPEVPFVQGRAPLYQPDTTWQASVTVPVYQQVDKSKTTPLLWAGAQEAKVRIEALEATTAAQAATIAAMQTQIAALTAAKAA